MRLVQRGIATLAELRSGVWTREDVLDFNDYLDAIDEAREPEPSSRGG